MRRADRLLLLLLILCTSFSPGYSARSASRVLAPKSAADPLRRLHADLDKIFSAESFANAQWGVEVLSLDRPEILYDRNSARLYMPASNNKLITCAVALVCLGPDYRFETRVLTDGEIVNGLLKGNLVIVGSGDPSNAPRFQSGDPFRNFENWAAQLKGIGIRAIEGDIIGDGGAFEEMMLGRGWQWDDLAYGYAAPVSALQFNENLATLEITPGDKEGSKPSVRILPLADYLTLDNRLVTAAQGNLPHVEITRGRPKESFVLHGTVPLKGNSVTQAVAVQLPTRYFLFALKHVLTREGIDTSRCRVKEVRDFNSPPLSLKWIHYSSPLSEILKPLMKNSLNLYAETMTRTLGLVLKHEGTFAKGKEIVEETLGDMAIEKGSYSYADGSGLSRLNLVSADLLVRILKFMHGHKYFPDFFNLLPIAGVDATIAGRMKGTKAENNVHAKTGTSANVRSLSGYVRTADGEMLAFSMIANNFLVSNEAAELVQDSALVKLANFSRKPPPGRGNPKNTIPRH